MALGKVKEVDVAFREVEWGEYMSVGVELDITMPLIGWKKFNFGLLESV